MYSFFGVWSFLWSGVVLRGTAWAGLGRVWDLVLRGLGAVVNDVGTHPFQPQTRNPKPQIPRPQNPNPQIPKPLNLNSLNP